MTRMMTRWFITGCIIISIASMIEGFLKCDCKKRTCESNLNCTVGMHKDMCGCCDVCAKREGELCGGLNRFKGDCGHRMQCMVRDIQNRRNRGKQTIPELIGRCEYVPCHYKSCDIGQTCTLVAGKAHCSCPQCREMIESPVCGESNHKNYKNECELRTEECLTGSKIGLIPSRCENYKNSQIICKQDSIRVELANSILNHVSRDKRKITLMDTNCVFQQNETHYFIETKFHECGTKVKFTLTYLVYSNLIRSELDPNTIIIRKRDSVQIPVECFYSLRTVNLYNDVSIQAAGRFGDRIEEKLRGNGVGIKVVDNREKRDPTDTIKTNDITVDFDRNEKYLVELRAKALKSSTSSAILLPRYCYVTPIERNERWMRYSLIEEGCPVENGVEILKSKSATTIKLMVPGIHFEGTELPGFLVRCKIRACFPRDPNNTLMCHKDCRRNGRKSRKRRQVNPTRDILLDYELQGSPILVTD